MPYIVTNDGFRLLSEVERGGWGKPAVIDSHRYLFGPKDK